MSKKIQVDILIEGGKATAAPPLGPALGPTGVNIGQVVSEINKKTAELKGMQVPVKVTIDTTNKEFSIEIGTPPASALIKKEAGIQKGANNPLTEKVADLKIEQIIKIAKTKEDSLLGSSMKGKVKEILGTCQSMGILVESTPAYETIKRVNQGEFDNQILGGKTELTEQELKQLEIEKEKLRKENEKRAAEFTKTAEQIKGKYKDGKKARKVMADKGIPQNIIDQVCPEN